MTHRHMQHSLSYQISLQFNYRTANTHTHPQVDELFENQFLGDTFHHINTNTHTVYTHTHARASKSQASKWFMINNDLKPEYPKHCSLKGENDRMVES